MTTSHFAGAVVSFGNDPTQSNPDAGPSMFVGGQGLMDPREFYAYTPGRSSGTTGIYASSPLLVMSLTGAVNVAANLDSIAADQVPVAGTAMTLNGTGTGVTLASSLVSAATGQTVTGVAAIGGVTAWVTFGANRWLDPRTTMTRTINIDSVGDDSGATFDVDGYDLYNYPMFETITGANATTAAGIKAFKSISSITPRGTLSGSNVSVGISLVTGLPIYSPQREFVAVYQNASGTPVAAGTYVAGVTTDPATATTGDVRGRYTPTAAQTLVVYQTIPVWNISATTTTGLFGIAQYTA